MRYIQLILLILVLASCSKKMCSEVQLYESFDKKNTALVEENLQTLKDLTLPQLNFVHSNGWREDIHSFLTKSDVKQLKYNAIKVDSLHAIIVENTGILSGLGSFDIKYKNNDLKLNLYFTETYVCTDHGWKLLARHSCKKP